MAPTKFTVSSSTSTGGAHDAGAITDDNDVKCKALKLCFLVYWYLQSFDPCSFQLVKKGYLINNVKKVGRCPPNE